jgi:flagellar biosynthesis protein FliQ
MLREMPASGSTCWMILIFRTPHLVEQLSLSILIAYFQQIGSIAESCSFETLLARFGA